MNDTVKEAKSLLEKRLDEINREKSTIEYALKGLNRRRPGRPPKRDKSAEAQLQPQ